MGSDDVIGVLSTHSEDLRRHGVRSLALFGSAARGDQRPDSDVDLVVEFEGPATFDGYLDLALYLESLLGRPVDLLTRRSHRDRFLSRIEGDLQYVPGFTPLQIAIN